MRIEPEPKLSFLCLQRTRTDRRNLTFGTTRTQAVRVHSHLQTKPLSHPNNNTRSLAARKTLAVRSAALSLPAKFSRSFLALEGAYNQGGICRGGGHVLVTQFRRTAMAYFVLMCYGHSISSPSLTLPTDTTVVTTTTRLRFDGRSTAFQRSLRSQ